MHRSQPFFIVICFLLGTALSGCIARPVAQSDQQLTLPSVTGTPVTSPTTETSSGQQTVYEFTATQSGQVALQLLESHVTVETKDFGSAGKFVTSINGVVGGSTHYWAFYINGKYAEVGASQALLKRGDVIKFVYEAVQATK